MKPYYQDEFAEVYIGDSTKIATEVVGAGTVDLIFTDPPYPKQYHYCYEFLAKEAARVLKPNGFIIAYAGPYWKHKVMMTLGEYLDYFYDFVLMHNGNTSILWPRRIITGYKSLLCYTLKNSKGLPVTNVIGKYDGTGSDKRFHMWGQDAVSAQYYIEMFSRPGDLVVDYFLGGGTTAAVCKKIRRKVIGIEIDFQTCKTTYDRLEGILPDGKSEQLELIK